MTDIKKILLVGTGLIGGSLALNIKEEFPEMIIYGLDNNQESLKLALQSGVISKIALNFEETVQEVQMVILCTPVKQAMSYLQTACQSTIDSTDFSDRCWQYEDGNYVDGKKP